MADSGTWYLKMDDGTVYGPADLKRLQAWAREGRIGSSSQISSDRKSWTPASLLPELGMEWIIEVGQGEYFGPFHPDVIRDLIAQKRVPASARRFRLDTGRAQEDHSKELNAALAKARAAVTERESALAKARAAVAERDGSLAELKAAAAEQKTLIAELRGREAGLTERLEKAKSQAETLRVHAEGLEAALAEQKALIAGLRGREAGWAAQLEKSQEASKSAVVASSSRIGELEAALGEVRTHAKALERSLELSRSETTAWRARAAELGAALEESRSETAAERMRSKGLSSELAESKAAAAASASRVEELASALKAEHARAEEASAALEAEHVRVENLLAQLVSAAEREKALRVDLDLAHKTAASERKCVEAAIRRERQAAKELEDARKDAEDLRVKMQKAREQPRAMKGKGGLFQGASAAELAFLEQAARRELASARGRAAPVPRPQPKAPDVIDV